MKAMKAMRRFVTTRLVLAIPFLLLAWTGCCCTTPFEPNPDKIHFFWPAGGVIFQGFYGDKISGEVPGMYYDEHDQQKVFTGPGRMHRAIDIVNSSGTKVTAAHDGIARRYDWNGVHAYGNRVVLDHQNGFYTLYAHLRKITVQDGQALRAGDALGEMGSTGNSTGPHLHFEIRHNPSGDMTILPHYIPGKAKTSVRQGDIVPYDYPK